MRGSDEPLTATQVSELVGESPANCSFHLRTLAKYGFIEEAGGGKGRSRPWRARDVGIQIHDDPDHPAPEGARELRDLLRGRAFRAIEKWENTDARDSPAPWQDAALAAEWELRLTADELQQINDEIVAILERYTARETIGEDAIRSKVLTWAFPLVAPESTSSAPVSRRQVGSHLRTSPGRRHRPPSDAEKPE